MRCPHMRRQPPMSPYEASNYALPPRMRRQPSVCYVTKFLTQDLYAVMKAGPLTKTLIPNPYMP